tara:strand:+ start:1236 stop:1784 length:549 start_codon:yes stop_codon:yes gene_type:complete
MKITRKTLRKIILTEIFEKGAEHYAFTLSKHIIDNYRPLIFEYEFTTDDNLDYVLTIMLPMVGLNDPGLKDRIHTFSWQIEFDVDDMYAGSYELTGSYDLKVLNTVIQIVKDFVTNIRPGLPTPVNQVNNFEASVAEEQDLTRGNRRDYRRARIYQYMMKKQGISAEISFDSADDMIIKFQI